MGENITDIVGTTQNFFMTLSMEVIVIAVLFALVFIYGLRAGKYKVVSLTLSTYVALILYLWFPYHHVLALDFGMLFDKFIISNVLLLVAAMILVHLLVGEICEEEYSTRRIRKLINLGLLSLGFSSVFMVSVYLTGNAVPSEGVVSSLDALFGAAKYQFWLLLSPLVIIFITTR